MPNGTPLVRHSLGEGGSRADQLVNLARPAIRKLMGSDLTAAEEKFLRAVAEGQIADFSSQKEEENDPANASQWKEERVLRAPCIAWLCTYPDASKFLTHRGIVLQGARIDGELDLHYAKIDVPLHFRGCAFAASINLKHADLKSLTLSGTHTLAIAADGLKVEGDVYLRNGFRAEGELRLPGASIGGDLDCTRGQFSNPGKDALSADGIRVEGDVFLRNGFKAAGEVRLLGASIGGDLDCGNGEFSNPGGDALSADRARIEGGVYLCSGFRAEGAVRLLGASIGGGLDCSSAQLSNPGKEALNADGIRVAGGVHLSDGFKAEGEVRLLGASIGGDLDCSSAQFSNPGEQALNADRAKVAGSVYLSDGFKAEGAVRLLDASIGGGLSCENGQFSNPGNRALGADRIKVEGGIFFRGGFEAEGIVSLGSAEIGKHLQWRSVRNPEKATLNLRSARVKTLWDEKASWPPKGQLYLQGFVYEELYHKAPATAKDRLDWLNRNNEELEKLPKDATRSEKRAPFAQPYQQLASVLRNAGQEDEADEILIEKNKRVAQWTQVGSGPWWWYNVMGPLVKYGYKPMVQFVGSLAIIVIGSVFFWWGNRCDLISPTHQDAYVQQNGKATTSVREDYPRLNSVVYSTEMFVPLVKFYQAEYWLPDANRGMIVFQYGDAKLTLGGLLRIYLWSHIAMGWTLTTIWVAGLTGVIKKSG
jgi:sRNA-binding regulator protein Hfq